MKLAKRLIGFGLAFLLGWGLSIKPVSAADLAPHAPDGAKVYIISPANGESVPSTFKVEFGLSGMGVAPAGIDKENTGHHHLLIDLEELPDLSQSLPATEQIRHFGGGQTETTLSLSQGQHRLQLVLGNYAHVPYDPPVISNPITVTVR
ncbi:MAG: DUF4399 domain-containing protein [Prochloraceae cyanobacterium]